MCLFCSLVIKCSKSVLSNSLADAFRRLYWIDRRLLMFLDNDLADADRLGNLSNIPASKSSIFPNNIWEADIFSLSVWLESRIRYTNSKDFHLKINCHKSTLINFHWLNRSTIAFSSLEYARVRHFTMPTRARNSLITSEMKCGPLSDLKDICFSNVIWEYARFRCRNIWQISKSISIGQTFV